MKHIKRKGNLQSSQSHVVNSSAHGKSRDFQNKALLDKFDALFRSSKENVVLEALEDAKQLPPQEKVMIYEKFFEAPTVLDSRLYKSQFPNEYWPLAVKKKLGASCRFGTDTMLFAEAKRILREEKCDLGLLKLAVREKFARVRNIDTFFLEDTNFSKACAWASGGLMLAVSIYAGMTKKIDGTATVLLGIFGTAAAGVAGFIAGEILCRLGNLAAKPLLFIDAFAYAVSASVAYHFNKKKARNVEICQAHEEKTKRDFAARARSFWDGNIRAISRVAGIGTSAATIFLFDKFVVGGDLAIEGLKIMLYGNIEPLGWIIGLPATICIEGLVLYVGYCIGRSIDP